jgi:hypothetical protein
VINTGSLESPDYPDEAFTPTTPWPSTFDYSINCPDSNTQHQRDDDDESTSGPLGVPVPDYEWRGPSDKGAWYNPETGEYVRPDPDHGWPPGAHIDYRDANGGRWRVHPTDGRFEPKG